MFRVESLLSHPVGNKNSVGSDTGLRQLDWGRGMKWISRRVKIGQLRPSQNIWVWG
jgi:hypothetical protein